MLEKECGLVCENAQKSAHMNHLVYWHAHSESGNPLGRPIREVGFLYWIKKDYEEEMDRLLAIPDIYKLLSGNPMHKLKLKKESNWGFSLTRRRGIWYFELQSTPYILLAQDS